MNPWRMLSRKKYNDEVYRRIRKGAVRSRIVYATMMALPAAVAVAVNLALFYGYSAGIFPPGLPRMH